MSSNFRRSLFLETIEQTGQRANQTSNDEEKLVEKVFLARPENQGRYQIFPMNSTITGLPFVEMPKTREIKIPRTLKKSDGTEMVYEYWVRILPHSAYNIVDQTDRIVSGLTSQESQLLTSLQIAFDRLYENMGGYEKDRDKNLTIGRLRKKNYTIFFAKCLQKWGLGNPRVAERSNFSALFVCAAKGFMEIVRDNVEEISVEENGDEWLDQVYSRDLTGRTGYLTFNISLPQNSVGYKLSVDHKFNSQQYVHETITPEEAMVMSDPVQMFLGWQVDKEHNRNFNTKIMEETLALINSELQKYPNAPESSKKAPAKPAAETAPFEAFGTANTAGATSAQPASPNVDPFTGGPADSNDSGWSNPGFAQSPWGNQQQ